MAQRGTYLANQGVPLVVAIAPNKHTTYGDMLPAWIRPQGLADYDRVMAMGENAALHLVDLRSALVSARATRRTYHLTDTHWNVWGAWSAHRCVIAELSTYGIGTAPLLDVELTAEQRPGGDLARILGLRDVMLETSIAVGPVALPTSELRRTEMIDGWEVRTFEAEGAPAASVMFIGDSFLTSTQSGMEQFLTRRFSRTYVVRDREVRFPTALITRYRPDAVVFEIVERRLDFPVVNEWLADTRPD